MAHAAESSTSHTDTGVNEPSFSEERTAERDQGDVLLLAAESWLNQGKSSAVCVIEDLLNVALVQEFGETLVRNSTGPDTIEIPRWTVESTERLILEHGERIINAVNSAGRPLIFDALSSGRLRCARRLFNYAKERNIPVKFSWGDRDMLKWAIDESEECTQLVLERLLEKCSTVQETCRVLTANFSALVIKYPKLMADLLERDKFSFEYGSLSVPRSLFSKADGQPIVMMTDDSLEEWTASDEAIRNLWMTNCTEHAGKFADNESSQVMTVSKFFCIDQPFQSSIKQDQTKWLGFIGRRLLPWLFGENLLLLLAKSHLSVDVFNSLTLTELTNWKHASLRNRLWLTFILDAMFAIAFSLFAAFWDPTPDTGRNDLYTVLCAFAILLHIRIFSQGNRSIFGRLTVGLSCLIFVFLLFLSEDDITYLTVAISLECILCWILVAQSLLPFERIGPLISMMRHAFLDALPFALSIAAIILGFALAFFVLFNKNYVESEVDEFSSVLRSFETVFHACTGNSDLEILYSSGNSLLKALRSILFIVYVFAAGVVLLSLLVAILSDTYDKVRLTEKAELVRCRALVLGRIIRSGMEPTPADIDTVHTEIETAYGFLLGWLWKRIYQLATCVNWQFEPNIILRDCILPREDDQRRFFHFLVPADENGHQCVDDPWQGRIHAVQKAVKNEVQNVKQELNAKMEASGCKISALEGQVHTLATQTQNLAERCAGLEEKVGNMEELLKQLLQK